MSESDLIIENAFLRETVNRLQQRLDALTKPDSGRQVADSRDDAAIPSPFTLHEPGLCL